MNKKNVRLRITVIIDLIACISLVVGAYAAFPNMHYIVTGVGLDFFENIALVIEALGFIITALLLLFYLKSQSSKLYKTISLIFLITLIVGYAYCIMLGFNSGNHKFDSQCITLIGLPNLFALIFGITLVIPVNSKRLLITRVSMATANVVIWLLLGLFQLSMTLSWGMDFVKLNDILESLLFVGIWMLFIVFAIIEGAKITKFEEIQNPQSAKY